MVLFCRESESGKGKLAKISISLHVQPRGRKTEIVGVHGDALKVKVAAPPVDGAANEELIRFFAKFLGVAKSQVEIRHGDQSRRKVIEVSGVTTAEFTDLLLKHGLMTISFG